MAPALLQQLSPERVGWFGAGLSAAALGLVGFQLMSGLLVAPISPLAAQLPGPPGAPPSATLVLIGASPRLSPTPWPTRTPRPTSTPSPPRASSTVGSRADVVTPEPSPRPPATPWPTRTPRPTSTPRPPRPT